jgi:hypothetical protein
MIINILYSTISLEEATRSSTTESAQSPSSTILLGEATGSSTVTIQPLSKSETSEIQLIFPY